MIITKTIIMVFTLLVTDISSYNIQYPIRYTYVKEIKSWSSQQDILAGLGVPGYAKPHSYNYIAFAFWTMRGIVDAAKIWDDPIRYIGVNLELGTTKDQMQKNIKKKYNDKGIKLLGSAFGQAQLPSFKYDPIKVANSLAKWINQNNLDGVDINFRDEQAVRDGDEIYWLVTFQETLKQLLPNHLISISCKAYYFRAFLNQRQFGYEYINKNVGKFIDFYIIEYFNHNESKFDTYNTLFKSSKGWCLNTAVKELVMEKGIPMEKIVIGKPATKKDMINTGWVNATQLNKWFVQAYKQLGWKAGLMLWEYKNDMDGEIMQTAIKGLMGQIEKEKRKSIENIRNKSNQTQNSTTAGSKLNQLNFSLEVKNINGSQASIVQIKVENSSIHNKK